MTQESVPFPQAVLLGFLMPGPQHGYRLHQEFERELGQVWYIGRSQLYAYLKHLADAGLVRVEVEPSDSYPPRKVYRLMPAGERAFQRWLKEPTPFLRQIRIEFLARLYFYRRLSLPGLEELIARQKAVLAARIDGQRRAAAETEDVFTQLVAEFRQGQMEAVIRWLERCLEGSHL
jgi:PadR family transcriptional regulator AphA